MLLLISMQATGHLFFSLARVHHPRSFEVTEQVSSTLTSPRQPERVLWGRSIWLEGKPKGLRNRPLAASAESWKLVGTIGSLQTKHACFMALLQVGFRASICVVNHLITFGTEYNPYAGSQRAHNNKSALWKFTRGMTSTVNSSPQVDILWSHRW